MGSVRKVRLVFPFVFLFVFVFSASGQKTIYSHFFYQNKNLKNNESKRSDNTTSPAFFETPIINFSQGINLLSIKYHVSSADVKSEFLSIYLKSDQQKEPLLIAKFIPQLNEGKEVFFIPGQVDNASIVFDQIQSLSFNLEDISVLTFFDANAYSENNSIFIDSAFNLQSTFYEVPISPYQRLPLPGNSETEIKSTNAVPVSCPSNSILENEPDCKNGYKDSTNRGCNYDLTMPMAFSQLYDCKGSVCGKSGTYTDGIPSRDVDWYLLPGTGAVNVTLKVVADFRVKIYVLSLLSGCTVFLSSNAVSAYAGDTAIINYTTDISTSGIAFWVAPYTTSGVTCGSKYFLKYSLGSNIITPVSPVPASNPACVSTTLLPMSPVSGYTLFWQDNTCGYSTNNPATSSYPITQSGNYYVKAKYNTIGCWTSCSGASVSIISNFLSSATSTSDSICAGNPVTLQAGGANSYLWTPGNISGSQIVVSPAITTNYTVTGTYGPCTATTSVSVFVNPKPSISILSSALSICAGDSCLLNANSSVPGTSFVWDYLNFSGSTISVSPQSSANYGVTGTTSKGCSSVENVAVEVRPVPLITVSSNASSICKRDSITINAQSSLPGTTFYWYPVQFAGNEIKVSPDTSTFYKVTGNSSTGCSRIDSINIHVNPQPVIALSTSKSVICAGDSSALYAGSNIPGTTFTWYPENISGTVLYIAPMFSTTYTVVGTTPEGCSESAEISITVNPTPTLTVSKAPQSVCEGTSTNLSVISDLQETTLTWQPIGQSGEEVTVIPISTTSFTVTGLSIEGCYSMIEIPLVVNPKPKLNITVNDSILCQRDSSIMTAVSTITGTSFLWMPENLNNTEIHVAPNNSTLYTLAGISPEGCMDTVSSLIIVHENPELTVKNLPAYICDGIATDISVASTITETFYTWYPSLQTGNEIIVSPHSTSTYTVIGQTPFGCQDTLLFELNVKPKPIVSLASDRSEICLYDSCILTATSTEEFTVFSWLNLSDTGKIIKPCPENNTLYTSIGTTHYGCTDSASLSIIVHPLPQMGISASPSQICQGASSLLSVSSDDPETMYEWSGGITGNETIVNPQFTTHYLVFGTNSYGCVDSTDLTLLVHPKPDISAIASPASICSGNSSLIALSSNISATTYYLFSDSIYGDSIMVSPLINSTYTIKGITTFGCTDTTDISVTVLFPPSANVSISGPNDVFQGQRLVSYAVPPIPEANDYIWELPSDSIIITNQHAIVTDINQPAQSALIRLSCENTCGHSDTLTKPITIHPPYKFLKLKAFIEGLYQGNNQMQETKNEFFLSNFVDGIADTLTVELRAETTYNLIEKYSGLPLQTDGLIYIPDINAELNQKYYITLIHRNSTPVTTAMPVDFLWNDSIYYDFTTSSEQAYGSQAQTSVEPGVYALYSGELSRDLYYIIDLEDLSMIEPDIEIGTIGYLITDLDGSGWVDLSDLSIIEKNLIIGPFYQHP